MIEDNETKSFLQAIIDNDDRIMYLVFSDGLLHEILNFVPENEDTSLVLERISRDWENPSTYMEGKFSNKLILTPSHLKGLHLAELLNQNSIDQMQNFLQVYRTPWYIKTGSVLVLMVFERFV